MLLTIVFLSSALPAFAWNREDEKTTHSVIWDPFLVWSYSTGQSNGQYFTDWAHDWDHGPTMDGIPPYFTCYYDHRYYHFPLQDPQYVETLSWGDVYDKFDEHVEHFEAMAYVNA